MNRSIHLILKKGKRYKIWTFKLKRLAIETANTAIIKTLIRNKYEDRPISSIVLTENEYKQLYKYICNYEFEYIKSLLLHHDSIVVDGTQFKIECERGI
jgi:hypothetical protein